MKTVSNDFKLNVNNFGRQLDTLIYDWYKPENGYKPLVGETTQDGTPTPDSPVSIETVTGLQEIDIVGKNLFDKDSGFRLGFINSNGGFTNQNYTACFNQYIPCQPNTTYTISFSKEITNMTAPIYYDKTKTFLSRASASTYFTKKTITTPANCYYMIIQFNYDNITMTQEIIDSVNCQVELGSTATTYEPYIGKSYEINLGKNLFNYNEYPVNRTIAGVTITNNGDGSFTLNGTCNSDNASFTLGSLKIPQDLAYNGVFTHTAYYVSGSCTKTSTSTSRCVIQVNYNVGSSMIPLEQLNANNNVISKTQGKRTNSSGWVWRILLASGDVYDNFTIKYQLEKGSQATSYSPYKTPIELCKIDDYQDYIYKENGNWYIHKEIGKAVLDGSETYTTSTAGGNRRFATILSNAILISSRTTILSNYFTYSSNTNDIGVCFLSNGSAYLYPNADITTIPLFQSWLSTHNTEVYYALATPTDTIIEDEELIGQLEAVRLLNTLGRDNIFNINPNFHTNIMETLMKSMNIEADTSANIGDEIDVYSGVKVGNSYEYINYGKYNVKEIEKDEVEKSYKIKCYDDMMLTMVDYDLQVTYPISVKNLLLAICNHFGFTLDTTTFVNDDNMITTDVFSNIGMTYRDVLSELAIATCSTIEIENGIMYLKYPVNTDLVINEDILNDKNVATGKKYGPVNKLVITKTGDVDPEVEEDTSSIELNGATEIKISDKQIFSTEETRDNLITEMWNYIKGFEYYICDLDTQGLMYVEPLDMFNVSVDNNTYQTIALNDETNISDGLNEEIFNEEIETTESNYKYTKSEDKKARNAYIEIDKQNATIRSIATEMVEQSEIINGTPTYTITTDTTFQADKPYYKFVDNDYIELVEGTDYNDGDAISSVGYDVYDIIYVDSIIDTMNDTIQNQISKAMPIIQSTLLEQTSENFTMWFNKTGIKKDIEDLQSLTGENKTNIENIKAYIEYGTMPVGSGYDGSPYILLGKAGSQTQLRILDNRIQFLSSGKETAFISNNTLYINESTVLTKQTIGNNNGRWITDVDSQGNLNTYWGG